jgi:hypothetical protein
MANVSRSAVRDQHGSVLSSRTVHFRYATESDAQRILDLRRAPSRAGTLAETPDNVSAQRLWLAGYQKRHAECTEHYFVVCTSNGMAIGTARVHDATKSSCWWGSWVLDPSSPVSAPLESYLMVNFFMFEILKVRETRFCVRRTNLPVLRFHDAMASRRASECSDEIQYLSDAAWYRSLRRRHDSHFSMITRPKDPVL